METAHTQNSCKAGSTQVLEIDIDSILAIQNNQGDEGLTTVEWAEELGISQRKMQQALKIGLQEGMFVMGYAPRKTFDGRNYRAKVFRYTS